MAAAFSWSAPLPPPDLLKQYNEVFPGCAERIVAMAESQSSHRQQVESNVIAGNVTSQTTGLWLGFIHRDSECCLAGLHRACSVGSCIRWLSTRKSRECICAWQAPANETTRITSGRYTSIFPTRLTISRTVNDSVTRPAPCYKCSVAHHELDPLRHHQQSALPRSHASFLRRPLRRPDPQHPRQIKSSQPYRRRSNSSTTTTKSTIISPPGHINHPPPIPPPPILEYPTPMHPESMLATTSPVPSIATVLAMPFASTPSMSFILTPRLYSSDAKSSVLIRQTHETRSLCLSNLSLIPA